MDFVSVLLLSRCLPGHFVNFSSKKLKPHLPNTLPVFYCTLQSSILLVETQGLQNSHILFSLMAIAKLKKDLILCCMLL